MTGCPPAIPPIVSSPPAVPATVPPAANTTPPADYILSQSPLESDAEPTQPAPTVSVASVETLIISLPDAPGRQQVKEVSKTMAEITKTGPGYSFDPYKDETAETFIVWKIIMWLASKFFGIKLDEGGFCSTYREWHILWEGAWAGIKAPQLADIPECPPLWASEEGYEAQYYKGAAIVCNVAKCYGTASAATLVAVFAWANSSGILKSFGIGA